MNDKKSRIVERIPPVSLGKLYEWIRPITPDSKWSKFIVPYKVELVKTKTKIEYDEWEVYALAMFENETKTIGFVLKYCEYAVNIKEVQL